MFSSSKAEKNKSSQRNAFPSCPARKILKHFQTKCWSFEEDELCSQTDFSQDGCLELMDPGLLLGDEPECKKAFLATLGTVLHHPCSCNGVHNDYVLTCSRIHDVLHNRSLFSEYGLNLGNANKQKCTSNGKKHIQGSLLCFMCIPVMPWQSSSGPLKPPKMDESGQNLTWPHSKFPGGFSVRSSSPMKGWVNGFISSRFYLFCPFQITSCTLLRACYWLVSSYWCLWLWSVKYGEETDVTGIPSTSLILDGNCCAFLHAGWWKEEMRKCFIRCRKATALLFSDGLWWNVCQI